MKIIVALNQIKIIWLAKNVFFVLKTFKRRTDILFDLITGSVIFIYLLASNRLGSSF